MRIHASLAALGALLLFFPLHRALAQTVEAPSMMGASDEDGADARGAPGAARHDGADATADRMDGPLASRPPSAGTAHREVDAKGPNTRSGPSAEGPPASAAPRSAIPHELLKPILTPRVGDDDLVATWNRWRKAVTEMRPGDAEAAQRELLTLKEDLAAADLEGFSLGFVRASEVREQEKDALGAVTLARVAVELAPDLPYSHLRLARAYFDSDPLVPGRYAGELWAAAQSVFSDPRFARSVLADVGAAALLALLATASLTLLVLFLRRLRYLLHDVHHLFPKAARRWQSAAVVFLLLSLPLVFRLGLAPVLVTLFVAVTLHLAPAERVVAAVMLVLVGLVPSAAGLLATHTAFAGTAAEDVYLLERGGLQASDAAARVQHRSNENKADFAEQFALARYLARRGRTADAIALYKQAATRKNGDARLLTNLGNAVLTQGDSDGAAELYMEATQADPSLASAFYDLAKVYYRRATIATNEQVGPELDRAQSALTTAQRIDRALLTRQDPPPDRLLANRLLLSPGLSTSEVLALTGDEHGQKIAAQLSVRVLGDFDPFAAAVYPAGFALLFLLIGQVRKGRGVSRPCDKCGRPVCRRCDPELGLGTTLCNQCVHVFARKGAVAGAVKVRKQIEIRRYQRARNRASYLFAALCSGLGHLFSGFPVRGAIYAFCFLFGVATVFLRDGVVRAPYGPAPLWISMVPVGLLIGLVYFLSLRGLYRRQAE